MKEYDVPSDPRSTVALLLAQTRDAMERQLAKELRPLDISPIQSAVLFFIDYMGGRTTPGKIAAWLAHKPHSVSMLLTRMEKAGLVSKQRDRVKESSVIVTMTEKGRQIYSQSTKTKSIREIMSCLSEEELNQLGLLLKKLRDKAT